jgi:molybdopterin-guanine dinucleotide biosynthesis protein A
MSPPDRPDPATPPAAVILCGGQSRRMGRPKASLPFGPELLLPRMVRIVSAVCRPIVVVAAPGQDLPDLPAGVIHARDEIEGRGPLQGLAAGLDALPDGVDLAFATATDAPFLDPAWILHLIDRVGVDFDLAMPEADGRLHPLAAVYRVGAVRPAIARLLAADRLRPIYLLDEVRGRVVPADDLRAIDPDLATLANLNTPEEYEAALRRAGFDPPT